MEKNEKLRKLEDKYLACYAPLYKAGEIFEGTVYGVDVQRGKLLVDLIRGGSCQVDMVCCRTAWKKGDVVEVVYMPQTATRWEPDKSFSLSFRYLKSRFPYEKFGDERCGKILVCGTNAILVMLDGNEGTVGRYLPPYGAVPRYLQNLKVGDNVICSCTQNGGIISIDEILGC